MTKKLLATSMWPGIVVRGVYLQFTQLKELLTEEARRVPQYLERRRKYNQHVAKHRRRQELWAHVG